MPSASRPPVPETGSVEGADSARAVAAAARVAREETTQAVTLANTYVKRFRAAHKRYDRLAKRATGTRQARLQREAKLAKKHYRTAVRARTKARGALTKAQAAVKAANCPT